MAINLQYSFPDVPLSITNPFVNTANALDTEGPLPFLTFIKTVSGSYEPEGLQAYYTHYLQLWNTTKQNSSADSRQIIVDRYSEFLKDISIDYTTLAERKFLSNMDFTDPHDLEVAVSFYARKLRDIALYYNKKRDDAKFELTRKKLRGSNLGVTRKIYELTLDYLSNRQDNKLEYSIESIKDSLEIEIGELFDTTSTYFNQEPNETVYDFQSRDFNVDVFLFDDNTVLNSIFSNLSDELRSLQETGALLDTKRALTQKYIGSNYFYLSAGVKLLSSDTHVQFITGAAFTSDNPILNFQNRDYPTIASTVRGNLADKRQVGFFRPNKFSIVCVDTKNNSYTINKDALAENTLYYFPDPEVYGNALDVITFVVDDTRCKNNISTGNAQNQPVTGPGDTSYYGYTSLIQPSPGLDHDFNYIFDQGYVHDQKHDIYGNTFGLVKNNGNFRRNVETIEKQYIKDLQLNGHTFYDTQFNEGFSFNYATALSSTTSETVRSGISSFTNSFSGNALSAYYLSFRYFSPYEDLIAPQLDTTTYEVKDNAYFTYSLDEFLPDPQSSDLSAFPGSNLFYYTELLECGLNSIVPLQRALLDSSVPTITANFTANIGLSANPNVAQIDCGMFTTPFDLNITLNTKTPAYIDEVTNSTIYNVVSTIAQPMKLRDDLLGKVFVKNYATGIVIPIEQALPYMQAKYTSAVYAQLTGSVLNFDLAYDTYFIQTPNYLVIDKISYKDNEFVTPATFNNVIELGENKFSVVSNRFKTNDGIYYYTLNLLENSLSATTNAIVYPEIYRFSYSLHSNEKIFPRTSAELLALSALFATNGGAVKFVEAASPVITFNSTNNLFNISYLLKDNNQLPCLYSYDFDYTGADVAFLSGSNYAATNDNNTFLFANTSTLSTFSFALSSAATHTQNNELIL